MRPLIAASVLCLLVSPSAWAEPPLSADDVARHHIGEGARIFDRAHPPSATAPPQGEPERALVYLHDLLRDPEHQFAYRTMLRAAYELPRWFRRYNTDQNGLAFPVEVKQIAGRRYEFAQVCRPRDAGQNCVLVIFDVGTDEGPVAWGLVRDEDGGEWWGRPPADVKRVAEAFEPS